MRGEKTGIPYTSQQLLEPHTARIRALLLAPRSWARARRLTNSFLAFCSFYQTKHDSLLCPSTPD